MSHAGVLGAGERVPADEALVAHGVDDRALGRADVGHDAVLAGGRERLRDRRGERADGRRDERRLGAVERAGEVRRRAVERADVERGVEHAVRGSQPATSAPSRSRAASPIEPPIRPTPTIAIFTGR